MASKVYWITLELVLNRSRRYIQKHQLQLQQNLTESQYNCVVDVLTAIISCLATLPVNSPNP